MADPSVTSIASGSATTQTVTVNFTGQAVNTLLEMNVSGDAYFATSGSGRPESTGWTKVDEEQHNAGHAKYWKLTDGSDTSVQYTFTAAAVSVHSVLAVTNIDTGDPFDVTGGQSVFTSGTTYTTTSVTPSAGRKIAIGAISGCRFDGGAAFTQGTWLNSYTEIEDLAASSGNTRESLGVAYLILDGGVSTSTGSTYSRESFGRGSIIAVYNVAADAPASTLPTLVMATRR